MNLQFDWSASSLEQRRMLFEACNLIRKKEGLSWAVFFARAGLGSGGADYEQNFRKGKIHRHRAAQIYRWLCFKHKPMAMHLVANLRKPKLRATPHAASYHDLLFRPRNYGWDGPIYADEEAPLDDELG